MGILINGFGFSYLKKIKVFYLIASNFKIWNVAQFCTGTLT